MLWNKEFVILSAFNEILNVVLIKVITSLMISTKYDTESILKVTVFWNKGYDVIVLVYHVTNKVWSRDSIYVVDVAMWPKVPKTLVFLWETLS